MLLRLTALTPEDGRVWMKLMSTYKRRQVSRGGGDHPPRHPRVPAQRRLRQALADICRERKRYSEAREHFRAAMKLDGQLASVYDSWGRMEALLGKAKARARALREGAGDSAVGAAVPRAGRSPRHAGPLRPCARRDPARPRSAQRGVKPTAAPRPWHGRGSRGKQRQSAFALLVGCEGAPIVHSRLPLARPARGAPRQQGRRAPPLRSGRQGQAA